MRPLLPAILAWLIVGTGGAQAAVVKPFDYSLNLSLESHTALEVVRGHWDEEEWVEEVCRIGDPCFPHEFAPLHVPLPATETATARFWLTSEGESGCEISSAILSFCQLDGLQSGALSFSSYLRSFNGGGFHLNLDAGTLVYRGEAGDYDPYSDPDCTPVFDDFCTYFGQQIEFKITSIAAPVVLPPAIPLPASAWLLLAALGGLAGLAFRSRAAT